MRSVLDGEEGLEEWRGGMRRFREEEEMFEEEEMVGIDWGSGPS